MPEYPDFDSVPRCEGQPQGNAWAYWGRDDELGTLNLLTPEAKLAAAREVTLGKSIQLDLRLDHFEHTIAGRETFEQTIIDFKEKCEGHGDYDIVAHDDVVRFNTQSSSQWDGLRHVGHQKSGVYYNGMKHRAIDESGSGRLGIQNWVINGGIVGRGVLLDYVRWRADTGQPPAVVDDCTPITAAELDAVAAHQKLSFRPGDILLVRSGFVAWHDSTPTEERNAALDRGRFIGLEPTQASARWLWNNHFAAVAGDTLSFEISPVPLTADKQTAGVVPLHEWLLTHWGSPIGELWDLESLAQACEVAGKWSFLLTSAPLHVYGGVATPSNAVALL